ncbi:gliding motility protein GldL [Xylanibacter muris]|uniref:Gliding motility protein GldL n=1 Tax=Xylanibacter muris TaxID=2736290 RepID=A0ABX2AMS3_9BACT|nr:gliding motility protein GldL [Xylanibacter muris]NPD92528.1 gliding motility protein GldL [Xylanibacter muris]
MTVYSKFNIVYRLQKWLDSVPGQTFLNYAYSWGASIVILGTLFKLTHLPGANIMLYLGMGTEVVVFFISAFDRPFDKTAIGKELPTHMEEDEEGQESGEFENTESESHAVQGGVSGGTIIIGGMQGASGEGISGGNVSLDNIPGGQVSTGGAAVAFAGTPEWMQQQQQVSPEMEEATNNYVDELKRLTEMLAKVADQSQRLTRDSEEMENLNRTLTGICKVYEMQLKGASAQIGTIDQINDQSRKMADQIAELNKIYARMIEAMTVNMRVAPVQGSDLRE